jgi:hypothetical protein
MTTSPNTAHLRNLNCYLKLFTDIAPLVSRQLVTPYRSSLAGC